MNATLAYSTKPKTYQMDLASEHLKEKYRKEFDKRNELYPYHLRIIFKNKSVVRHFETEREARFAFDQDTECTAILIKFNNTTGPRFVAYRYVL